MSAPPISAVPPLAHALAALLQRVAPDAPASLLQATRVLVALESRGHTVLPLHDGGRAARAELGWTPQYDLRAIVKSAWDWHRAEQSRAGA